MNIFKKKAGKQATKQNGKIPLGGRERRLLAESAQIEEELVPASVRPMLIIVAVMVVLALIWAALTNLTEVARAQGVIAPSGDVKVVQHLDGGVVSEIMVDDGALVEKGQELLRINGSKSITDLRKFEVRLISLRLRAERLSALAEGRTPDFDPIAQGHFDLLADQMEIYRAQVAARQSTLSILNRQMDQYTLRLRQKDELLSSAREHSAITGELKDMRENLASRRLVNRSVLLETRRAKITADSEVARYVEEINVVNQQLAETKARYTDTSNQMKRDALNEMGDARSKIAEVEETVQRLRDKVERLVVRAPERGYVHDLKVQTIGQVVQPGATLVQIVPAAARLQAVIQINSKDIGYVKIGQLVNLRVNSYDYTRFGFARGTLKNISATNITGTDGKPYFQGWVALTNSYVGDKPGHPLQAGMGVEAEILTGHRTMLAYLLKPLENLNSRSFSER